MWRERCRDLRQRRVSARCFSVWGPTVPPMPAPCTGSRPRNSRSRAWKSSGGLDVDAQTLPAGGVVEDEQPGVQRLVVDQVRGMTVDGVADDGVAQGRQVDADLVGAAGDEVTVEQRGVGEALPARGSRWSRACHPPRRPCGGGPSGRGRWGPRCGRRGGRASRRRRRRSAFRRCARGSDLGDAAGQGRSWRPS